MASAGNVLSIEQLNQLSRKPYSVHAGSDDDVDAIEGSKKLWMRLIDTVHNPTVSDKHMTAACNAICFTIRANVLSSNETLRELALCAKTWHQTFGAARSAFSAGKNKPALQVLETLAYLTGELPDRHDAIRLVESTVRDMAEIVYTQQPNKHLKEACIVLYFFLRKLSDFMSATVVLESALRNSQSAFSRVCASSNIALAKVTQEKSEPWFSFVLSILMVTKVAESKSATLKLLSLLCTDKFAIRDVDLVSTTSKAIDVYSAANDNALEDIIREVLPAVLTNSTQYHIFLRKQLDSSGSKISTLVVILGILSFGKVRNYITEDELPSLVNDILSGFFAFSLKSETFVGFETLLSHAIPSVRLRALDLLVASKSPNASIHPETFRCLIRVLPNLHDDTDAFHRGELFSVFRRFLIRIQQSHRMLNKDQAKDNLNDMLREYTTFCSRYCAFLKSEVLVHISYGRHILSLDLLNFISEQIWPQEAFATVSLSDEDFLATLFRLVLDPYDDIRAVSTNVLLNIANVRSVDFNLALERTNPMTSTSQLAAATNRADHADALGRLIALLQENSVISRRTTSEDKGSFLDLQEQVTALSAYIQGANNLDVTITYPLHGSILGMRYLLESSTLNYPSTTMAMWKEPLLVACQKIWTLSQPHLCVDSPEVEEDATDELGSSGPKDLLAYAWRALRDVHLMMQAMLDTSMADHAVFSTIGRMCFDQLALLRHRGAFSTVAQSFVLCCQKCRSSDDPDVQSLTSQWFGSALAELQKQADRLTRRSAGLPAMFTALLDPHDDHKFSLCVQELVQIAVQLAPDPRGAEAEDKLRLPQVHALNCLKDIMTTSRFRIRTAPLVVPMVDLAAQCMSSHIWAIKNCGLMLLRASINRLDPDTGVGGSKADVNIRALSDSGRQLSDVALSLLSSWSLETSASEEFVQAYSQDGNRIDDGNEAVFAGLDLIGRLYLNKDERLSVRDTVARQLGSHLWHIRAQAARLLTTTTPQDEQIAVVQEMLRRLNKSSSLNECHGKMLVVRGLLTSLQEGPISLEFLSSFAQSLVEASCAAPVALNKTFLATWLEIANQLISSTPANSTIPARLYETFSKQLNGFSSDDDQPVALYDRALAYFMLQVHVLTGSLTHDQAARYVGKDNDTIAYVFEQRQSSKSTAQSRRYFNVVKEVLQSTEMAQARPILLKRAVTCINSGLALPDTTDFTTLIDALQFEQSISRDIMIAQFSLYTALCKIAMQWNGVTTNRLRELSIGFCRHLKFAAADDTEEPTRCAVVEALQQWQDLALLDDMFNAIFESHGKLEVFSVLYDLLNDDDDEIRGKAGEVAAAFHQSNMRGSRRKIVLCAFAARQRLRDHGFRAFMGTEMLGLECVRRILNIRSKESPMQMKKEVVRYCQHNTIEKQILGVMAAANDLFAEEKQNLYIDEIVELKVWARVLTDMQCRIPDELVKVLSKWADDGLRSAHNLLEKVNGKLDQNNWEVEAAVLADKTATDLNISFTPELEILLVRVVAIAGILVQSGDSQRQEQDGVASKVLVSLQKLHEKCGSMSVPASLRESLHLII